MREQEKIGKDILIIGSDTLKIPMIAEAAKKRAEIEHEKEVERKKKENCPHISIDRPNDKDVFITYSYSVEPIDGGHFVPQLKSSQRRRYNRRKQF